MDRPDTTQSIEPGATDKYPMLRWTPEMVAAFWDFESQFPTRYFTYKNAAEVVRQLGRHFRDKERILDFGSGPGFLLDELLRAGYQAAASDLSPSTLAAIEARFSSHPRFEGTFTRDQLRNDARKFDAIMVTEVIEHLYDDDLKPLLAELRDYVASDGLLIFTTPNEEKLEESYVLCPTTGEVFHR